MERKRIPFIDFAAGILILWMIFQHAVETAWALGLGEYNVNPNASWFPYLNFFMPWFFYKSGAFFQKRGVKELWQKDYHKFFKTLALWSLIGYVVYILLGIYSHTLTLHDVIYAPTRRFFFDGYIAIELPLWFLLTLIGVRLVANISLPTRDSRFFHYRCAAIVTICALVAYVAHVYRNPYLPLWVANSASGCAFFTLGYWLHNYEKKAWFVLPCVIGYLSCCLFGWNSVIMMTNELLKGYYLLWFPSALCGIVCFNAVCRCLCEWMGKITPPQYSRYRTLEIIGKNAMPIYVTHSFVRFPLAAVLENYTISWEWILIIICVGYALVLPIVCILWNKISKIKTK